MKYPITELKDSADKLNMICLGSHSTIPDPFRNEWLVYTGETYQSFLDWLVKNPVTHVNCLRVPHSNGDKSLLNSPFISALVGLVLFALPHTRKRDQVLQSISAYLVGHLNNRGLIGFLEPNSHRHELDTLAICYSFLLLTTSDELSSKLRRIEPFLRQNRCPVSGAYYTWIEKSKNQVDYVVNMNIRFLRSVQGVADHGLDEFLVANLETFLSQGSHYYSDILFPRLLASVYHDICPFNSKDYLFESVLKKLRFPRSQTQGLLTEYPGPSDEPKWQSFHIPSYFNSRDATFQSMPLDKVLGMYISPKRIGLGARNLTEQRQKSNKL